MREAKREHGYVLLWPDTFLTKICIVSSFSDAVELMLETLDVRRMLVSVLVVDADVDVEVSRVWGRAS